MSKLMITAFSALAILSSCSKTTTDEPTNEGIKLVTSINGLARATNTAFEAGDKISVYAYEKNSTPKVFRFDNNEHTTANGTDWTGAKMEWAESDHNKTYNFIAIYPAELRVAGADLDNVEFTLSSTISNDLLVANPTTNITISDNTVDLVFSHIMSKLTVNLKYKVEFVTTPTVEGIKALGLNTTARINFFTKAFSNLTTTADIALNEVTVNETYNAIVLPQPIAIGTKMIQVTIAGKPYTFTTTEAITLAPNKHTTLNLSVGADGTITVGSITIADWGSEEEFNGNAPQE